MSAPFANHNREGQQLVACPWVARRRERGCLPAPRPPRAPNLGSDSKKRPNSLERLHTHRLSTLRTRTPSFHWASGRCSPFPLPLPTPPHPFYCWASGERWIGSRPCAPEGLVCSRLAVFLCALKPPGRFCRCTSAHCWRHSPFLRDLARALSKRWILPD